MKMPVSADGSKIAANASKHSAVSYGHASKTIEQLELEVAQLLAKAEQADATPLQDALSIPDEIVRRQERQAALEKARAEFELRAQARYVAELAEHERRWRPARRASPAGKNHAAKRPGHPARSRRRCAARQALDAMGFRRAARHLAARLGRHAICSKDCLPKTPNPQEQVRRAASRSANARPAHVPPSHGVAELPHKS
jgi:hypothetical protein